MSIKIALAGNPNCSKTTLFNNLTGSNQYVGNWLRRYRGKKEGKLKGDKGCHHQDLPSISPLSPTHAGRSSPVLTWSRRPDAILNIIDALPTLSATSTWPQLVRLGIPIVMAVNMIDLVRKNGDKIDLKKLSSELGCQAVEISALKGRAPGCCQGCGCRCPEQKAGELPRLTG